MGERLSVDDMISPAVAKSLGPGVIPTRAIVILETIDSDGEESFASMRYLLSHGTKSWQALGPLRSTLLKLEADDLECWRDED